MSVALSGPRTLRNNIIANSIGRLWSLLASVAFVPIYISYLGGTSYGLVVFQVTLFASLQVLDAGLSSALSREISLRLSRPSRETECPHSAANLVRTIEVLSILTAVLIGVAVYLAAPLIATRWLRSDGLPPEQAIQAVRLMGAVIAAQWPSIVYLAGIAGMQQQVKLNQVKVVTSTVQALGLVAVLAWISPTPSAYFLWVLLVQAGNTLWLRHTLWQSLGVEDGAAPLAGSRPRFDWRELIAIWRFAAGMAGISVLSALLMQTDKIILSRLVPLAEFGAYGVAYSVCSVLSAAVSPVFTAAVPRFTQMIGRAELPHLRGLYLSMCELAALMIVPAWVLLAFHSHELMRLWMGRGPEAATIAGLLPLIGTGWLANALVTLPLGLQIASGWTALSVYKNLIAVALVIPALIAVVPRYGATGAALVWLALNMGYLMFEIPIMHHRLLRGSAMTWYARTVAIPLAVATAAGLASKALFGAGLGTSGALIGMLLSAGITGITLIALLPSLRRTLLDPLLARLGSGKNVSLVRAALDGLQLAQAAHERDEERMSTDAATPVLTTAATPVEPACPVCHTAAPLALRAVDRNRSLPGSFTYYRCPECRLLFMEPIPANLGDYYAGGYQPKPRTLQALREMARSQADRLESILPYRATGKLLEIGPWIGMFSCNARDAGFEVTAIEVDQDCVALLKDVLGIRAIQSGDPAATLAQMDERFDVIVLWHSIEHVPRPWEVITQAARKLAHGGILVIGAPNPDSTQLAVLKEKWYHLDSPRHIHLLPQSLISRLAEREGLELVSATTNDKLGKLLDRSGWAEWIGTFVPIKGVRALAKRLGAPLLGRLHGSYKEGAGAGYTMVLRRP